VSLVALFIPLLLMGGIIGRLFREFAMTVTAAIGVSVVICLTLTPMLCSRFLLPQHNKQHGRVYRTIERGFDAMISGYRVVLDRALRHQATTLIVFLAAVAMTVAMFVVIPKAFFPIQDTPLLHRLSDPAHHASPP